MSWLVLLVIPVIAFIIGFLGSLAQSTARSTAHSVLADQLLQDSKLRAAALQLLLDNQKKGE